ncbi:MAG: glycosyltransferase, partial [Candidatus Latescibacterota bacterium]
MSAPHLSICIVNWNTRDLLKDCLESIYSDPESALWEVIVVDNASSDESAAMVQAHFPAALLVSLNANEGFVGANNIAMGRARAPYWLLLNSDTRVEQGALSQLVAFMEETPEAGAVGSKLLNDDGSLQLSCGIAPTFW